MKPTLRTKILQGQCFWAQAGMRLIGEELLRHRHPCRDWPPTALLAAGRFRRRSNGDRFALIKDARKASRDRIMDCPVGFISIDGETIAFKTAKRVGCITFSFILKGHSIEIGGIRAMSIANNDTLLTEITMEAVARATSFGK